MPHSKKTRRAAGFAAAAVVVAVAGVSAPVTALAAPPSPAGTMPALSAAAGTASALSAPAGTMSALSSPAGTMSALSSSAGTVSALTESGVLGAEFEDRFPAKLSGGTVIPVTVTGGTAGATATQFAALRITAKVGGLIARVAWVDENTLKVTAPATTMATAVTMQLFSKGVAGPESASTVSYLPVVSTIAPARISAAGGSTVAITGAGFLSVDADAPGAVRFGDANATSFTVVSATKIIAVAPPGQDGTAPVTVTTGAGTSAVVAAARITYRAVLGLDVSAGPVAKASGGPLVLTVTGPGLGANAKELAAQKVSVKVGTRLLPATYVDESHLKITMPAIAAESAQLTVLRDGFAGEPADVALAPVVTGLSAMADTVAGGARVTVKVAGADIAGATGFTFAGNPATCTPQGTGTSVTFLCTVPPSAQAGPGWVSFTSAAGTPSRFTAAAAFAYTTN